MSITTLLQAIVSQLLLLPLGAIIGALTERIASRKVPFVPNKIWNTAVKIVVAGLLWARFIFIQPSLDVIEKWQCVMLSSTVIIRCTFLYISTKFGTSLQPVGLTGGIACGKSTVSNLLRKTSRSNRKDAVAIVDVDGIAHDILVPGKFKAEDCAYHRVVATFENDNILETSKDGDKHPQYPPIDRRKLGDVIFRDHIKRRKLNSITHPLISKVMVKQMVWKYFFPSSNDTSIVAVDIPLLFEVGLKMKALFAIKVVVACSSELQLQRLKARNPDLTIEQCNKRIESQMPLYRKVEMADIVIWNNGNMDDLIAEVETARDDILSRKHALFGISLPVIIAIPGFIKALTCLHQIFIIQ